MGRSKARPPWGEVRTVKKRTDRKNPNKVTLHEISFQPKALTKGMKRLLRRDLRQNPQEAHRKMVLLGVTEAQIAKKKAKR
jgi:hypothetical protein